MSGGGDSVALLVVTAGWAARHGRRLVVLTVDHGLAPDSARWTEGVTALAARFGAEARVLRWTGPKPATGLPAAARTARHALLADAARAMGAGVVLLGHTADDVAEGAVMRAEGVPLGRVREWGPSPVWPEGRGVFLLRPLLDCSRAALRGWLVERDLPWIEDPANADLRYARVRARAELSISIDPSSRPQRTPALRRGERSAGTSGCAGVLALGPGAPPLRGSGRDDGLEGVGEGLVVLSRLDLTPAVLGVAVACASGALVPPRTARVERLHTRLSTPETFTATLGGARIVAAEGQVTIGRDAGEIARGGLAPLVLTPGEPAVWDGRFEVRTNVPGLTVAALKGHAARLPAAERLALKAVPAWARPALPVVLGPGLVTSPLLAPGPVHARCLISERLAAALGRVVSEP